MLFTEVSQFARRFDHAVLRPDATAEDVRAAAEGCVELGLRGLAVAPCHVRDAAEVMAGTPVKTVAVVGFPFGFTTGATKQFEALECEKLGAEELDVVINVGALKGGDDGLVERELQQVMERTPECLHKIIIETGLLTASEVSRAVRIVNRLQPRFIKTCTGYGPRGVTVADLELIRSDLRSGILVKASAGIRDLDSALALIEAGATVLGSSSTKRILDQLAERLSNQPPEEGD